MDFRERFGRTPEVAIRAPGRVNLIGEHTDYSLLPVLPVAIDRALIVSAAATDDGMVRVWSSAMAEEVSLARSILAAEPHHGWSRYLAGALHQLEDVAPGKGACLAIGGDLPVAGGLSSSAALTCGALAALSTVWAHLLDSEALVAKAILAERAVSAEVGGMDQQAIVFGEAGAALRIDFLPPARQLVQLPERLRFVVAFSGETAEKSGEARDAYNQRVVGARLAAAMLADQVGVEISTPAVLADVASVDVVDILVDDLPERISAQEVAHGAQVNVEQLVRLTNDRVDHMAKIPVKRVARHILSEAARVDMAEAALVAGDIPTFGKILNDSHNSLREDMRCSTAALDKICAAMRKAGANGARLTGAGFGGYALAAVPDGLVDAVIEAAIAATGGPAFEVRPAAGLGPV